MGEICWKNTLNSTFAWFGNIRLFAKVCYMANYPYFCWNDRVYRLEFDVEEGLKWSDTGMLKGDLK